MTKKRCILITLVASMILIGCGVQEKNEEIFLYENKNTGNELIIALDEFHSIYTKYPITLEELVPNFIEKLPSDEEKAEFHYKYYKGNFFLDFDNGDNLGCTYYSKFGFWECSIIGIDIE